MFSLSLKRRRTQSANGWLSDTLDVISQDLGEGSACISMVTTLRFSHLTMAFSTTLSKAFATFAASYVQRLDRAEEEEEDPPGCGQVSPEEDLPVMLKTCWLCLEKLRSFVYVRCLEEEADRDVQVCCGCSKRLVGCREGDICRVILRRPDHSRLPQLDQPR